MAGAPLNREATKSTRGLAFSSSAASSNAGSAIASYALYRGTSSVSEVADANMTCTSSTCTNNDCDMTRQGPYHEVAFDNAIGHGQRSNQATAR